MITLIFGLVSIISLAMIRDKDGEKVDERNDEDDENAGDATEMTMLMFR